MKLILTLLVLLAFALYAYGQTHATLDVERRAFLAGAATGWNPGTGQWEQYKIDRRDPDWGEAFEAWVREGRR
jgi:hypothetical protein